eukprot:1174236-Rhodomonas_salina.1
MRGLAQDFGACLISRPPFHFSRGLLMPLSRVQPSPRLSTVKPPCYPLNRQRPPPASAPACIPMGSNNLKRQGHGPRSRRGPGQTIRASDHHDLMITAHELHASPELHVDLPARGLGRDMAGERSPATTTSGKELSGDTATPDTDRKGERRKKTKKRWYRAWRTSSSAW